MGPLGCTFDAATGRLWALTPALATVLAIGEVPLRASDLFAELTDPSARRFVALVRDRDGRRRRFEVEVRPGAPGPLTPAGALETELVECGEHEDDLIAFEALWSLRPGLESLGRALAIIAAAAGRPLGLGVRAGSVLRVLRGPQTLHWPAPGARLRLEGGGAPNVLSIDGDAGRCLIAGSAEPIRPDWRGRPQAFALGEVIRRLEGPDAACGYAGAREIDASIEAVESAAAASRPRYIELSVAVGAAVEANHGRAAARTALDEIEERLRAFARRDDRLLRTGRDTFVLLVPRATDDDEVGGLLRRLDGVVRFPLTFDGYRYVPSLRTRVANIGEHGRTSTALAQAASRAGASESFGVMAETAGFLVAFAPVHALESRALVAAEIVVRRLHRRYGVLAPERLVTLTGDDEERSKLARWLSEEATAFLDAPEAKGLHQLYVNISSLTNSDPISDLGYNSCNGYRLKGLRFELTAQQVASVSRSGPGGEFAAPISLVAPFDLLATDRDRARALDAVAVPRAVAEPERDRAFEAHVVLAATVGYAKSFGALVRAVDIRDRARERSLRRAGVDLVQWLEPVSGALEFRRALASRAASGSP